MRLFKGILEKKVIVHNLPDDYVLTCTLINDENDSAYMGIKIVLTKKEQTTFGILWCGKLKRIKEVISDSYWCDACLILAKLALKENRENIWKETK